MSPPLVFGVATPMRRRSGLTLIEVLVALAVVFVLAALMLPTVRTAREAARRNGCVCHGKQIGLAIHNYHDVFTRFPSLTSTAIRGTRPGCTAPRDDAPRAGYSWHVMVLPYLEEMALYHAIEKASAQFQTPPFELDAADLPGDIGGARHFAQIELNVWRCPSYSGPLRSDAPEYACISGVATCNYVGFAATDVDRLLNSEDPAAANGILVPPPTSVTFKDIEDGSSKTFLFAETREPRYSSWYDGSVAWAVGADPNGDPPTRDETGLLVARSPTVLNLDPSADPTRPFLTPERHGLISQAWQWGPSSDHAGSVVVHGIADGAVRTLTSDVDPTLYLRLITRAGKEPANLPE